MSRVWDPKLDGLIRVSARYLAFGRAKVNVFWLWTPPPVTAGQLHDAAETVAAWDTVVGAGIRSEDSQLAAVMAQDRSNSPIAMYERQGVGQFGAVRNLTNPMLPDNTVPLVQWLTGQDVSRPHRTYAPCLTTLMWGFTLIPGTAIDDLDTLEEVAAVELETVYGSLREAFNLVTFCRMVAPTGQPTNFREITGQHVDRHWLGTRKKRGGWYQRGTRS